MGKSSTCSDCLITELPALHQTVNAHFQNIAESPPPIQMTLEGMNDRWRRAYSPMSAVQSSIYSNLMSPTTDEEWNSVLSSLPTSKASGPSGISYEMLKHLPPSALIYLREIIDLCLSSAYLLSAWKDATVYPIPKPQEWNCFLQNTRPITLLDTARKVLTHIMYQRLFNVFAKHQILTGGNFAGLSGCSCDAPIAQLEASMFDAHTHSK